MIVHWQVKAELPGSDIYRPIIPLSTLILCACRTRSHPAMPIVLSIAFFLFCLLLKLFLDIRRVGRDVGLVCL